MHLGNYGGKTPTKAMKKAAIAKHKSMKLGGGGRFAALKAKLAKKPGITNPGALAAFIGRKKYGKKKFAQLGLKGRIKHKGKVIF